MSTPPHDHSLPDRAFDAPNPFPGAGHRRLVALSLNTHLPPLSAFTPTKDIRYHPLFQGMLFPWVWRVWTQRFTKAGHYFVVATLFFTAFSSVSLDQQFYVAFTYAVGLWVVASLGMWLGRPRVSLTASCAERVQAGETLTVELVVQALGRRGIGLSVLPDRLPPAVDAVSEEGTELPALKPNETARVSLTLACRKRGVFRLRGFRVETAFPLGLMVAQQVFSEPRTLWVTPRFTPLGRMETPRGRRYQPGGTASALRLGDSFEFIGNREYREGDPVRAIDWRATARLSRPVVREYREEFLQRVMVVLDTHIPAPPGLPPPPSFESAVSLAAAVCEFCARAEFALDILAAGAEVHTLNAGPGLAALDPVLDLLAAVEADTRAAAGTDWERLEEDLSGQLSQTTLIVCVFLDWDTARQELAERLRDTGAGLKIVVVRDTPTTLPPGKWPVLTFSSNYGGCGRDMINSARKALYQHPPWPAAVAALLAYAALALSSGADIPLLGLGLALTASYAFQARFPNETLTKWTLRLVIMGTAVIGYLINATKDDNAFFDVRYLYSFALMSAAELTLQFWRREPTGGARAPFTVFLSAMVFLVGCSTFEETSRYLWYLAPAFFFFFMLALPGFRQQLSASALKFAVVPVLAALIVGTVTHAAVSRYKNELNLLGSQALPGRRLSPSMGMSGQPILGSSFTLRDSLTRVLRIDNPGTDPYLRGMTFDTYTGRTWGPSLDNRVFLSLPRQPAGPGPRARYERLDDAGGLLFAPLHTAALVPEDAHPIDWAAQTDGPLRTPPADTSALTYDVTKGKSGLLDTPPTTLETARDLAVPPDIDRRVLLKAHEVGDAPKTPEGKITAIVRFLQTNNSYSLTVNPGLGEPISNFILQRKAAHCEYFASAAVVMLRAAGVPTRYVSGYFAHEGDGRNTLLVRQRDAHAWAESWIAGTGWVTVDATPGGGRPDALAGPIPLYWQVWEKLQDLLGAVRTWVLTAGWLQKGTVFLLLVLGLLVPQVYRYWNSRRAQESGFRYSSPDAALAALSARFEALLARRGFPVPENRTWPEHLHAAEMEDSRAARRFVQDYSRARFGPAPTPADIAEIERTLQNLEQTLEKKS